MLFTQDSIFPDRMLHWFSFSPHPRTCFWSYLLSLHGLSSWVSSPETLFIHRWLCPCNTLLSASCWDSEIDLNHSRPQWTCFLLTEPEKFPTQHHLMTSAGPVTSQSQGKSRTESRKGPQRLPWLSLTFYKSGNWGTGRGSQCPAVLERVGRTAKRRPEVSSNASFS